MDAKKYQQALDAANKLIKAQEKLKSSSKEADYLWESISSRIFGIHKAEWFKVIPKTTEDIIEQSKEIEKMEDSLKNLGRSINQNFKKAFSSKEIGDFKNKLDITKDTIQKISQIGLEAGGNLAKATSAMAIEDMLKLQEQSEDRIVSQKKLNEFAKQYGITLKDAEEIQELVGKELSEETQISQMLNQVKDQQMRKALQIAIIEEDIVSFVKKYGDRAVNVLKTNTELSKVLGKESAEYNQINKGVKIQEKNLASVGKKVISIQNGLVKISQNFLRDVIPSVLKFDTALKEAQKNFGINMDNNSVKFSILVGKTIQFGMGAKEATEFMGQLGEELRTTDFGILSNAAYDLRAIQLATGISSQNLSKIAGEMMRAGGTSKDVRDAIGEANWNAKMFGVNSKKVLENVAKNIEKMRHMGFEGGIESLSKVAAKMESLRVSLEGIFKMGDMARTVEGAVKMAAELQLAGGSFSNINPMELLAAARKGPEELANILTSMGDDVGHWVKDMKGNEEYQFDPVDVDRLKIVAQATGQTVDELQKMIQKKAENVKKDAQISIGFEGFEDQNGKKIKGDDVKKFLEQSIDVNGKAIEGGVLAENNIEHISELTHAQLQKILLEEEKNAKNLEEQAKQNASLEKSWKALKDSLLNVFTLIEPMIKRITSAIQWFMDFLNDNPWAKDIAAAAIGFLAISMSFGGFVKIFSGTVGKFAKSVLSFGKSGISFISGLMKGKGVLESMGIGKSVVEESGGGIGGTKEIEKNVSNKKGTFLSKLSDDFSTIGRRKSVDLSKIAKFALAIGIIAAPLVILSLAYSAMGGDPWVLVALGAAIVELAFALSLSSKAKISEGNVIKLALAMAIVGVAMIPFAFAAKMMNGVNWLDTLAAIGILTLIIVGLTVLGALMSGPQIAFLAIGIGVLIAVSAGLLLFGLSLNAVAVSIAKLTTIDWSVLTEIPSALFGLIPALMAFSLAGMMMLTPFISVGLLMLVGTLSKLATVAVPLGIGMSMAASSMDKMASGAERLNTALRELDLDKMQKLQEISNSFSEAANGGNVAAFAEAMSKLASEKTNEGNGGVKTIVVKLQAPNGRTLQEQIINDIDKVS